MELRLVREFDAIAAVQAAIAELYEWEHYGPELIFSLQLAARLIPHACDSFEAVDHDRTPRLTALKTLEATDVRSPTR